jgi:hypothetical protein
MMMPKKRLVVNQLKFETATEECRSSYKWRKALIPRAHIRLVVRASVQSTNRGTIRLLMLEYSLKAPDDDIKKSADHVYLTVCVWDSKHSREGRKK